MDVTSQVFQKISFHLHDCYLPRSAVTAFSLLLFPFFPIPDRWWTSNMIVCSNFFKLINDQSVESVKWWRTKKSIFPSVGKNKKEAKRTKGHLSTMAWHWVWRWNIRWTLLPYAFFCRTKFIEVWPKTSHSCSSFLQKRPNPLPQNYWSMPCVWMMEITYLWTERN